MAMQRAERTESTSPDARAKLALAYSHYQARRYDDALGELEAALRYDSRLAPAHFLRGKVHVDQGHLTESAAAFQAAIAIDDTFAVAHLALGYVMLESGRYPEAFESCHRSVRLDPQLWMGYLILGRAYQEQGRGDEAIAAYREALRVNPHLTAAHYKMAQLLLERGEDAEAIAECKAALRLQALVPSARVALGNIHEALEEHPEAVREFRAAAGINPELKLAHYKAAEALCAQGDAAGALVEYRKALSLVSGAEKVTCLQRIGKIHAAEGDHPEALSSYLQALAIDPQRSEIYFHLADAFEALGREQEAQDARRRGLAIQSEAGMAPEGFDRTSLSSPADRGHG